MDSALNFGPMVLAMKVSGAMTKQTAKANLFTLMATSTKANGSTIKLRVKEPTAMPMAHIMRVHGSMISSTGMVLNHGQMVLVMKANTSKARKRETAG